MRWKAMRDALRVATVGALFLVHGVAAAALVQAIEYYHAGLDHYFVTAGADEIAKLDAGYFTGWQRTGEQFTVADPSTPLAGGSAVCRFYGNPGVGLDSHFYSASSAECAAVEANFPNAWLLESPDVFQVYLPDTATGACPAGSIAIYRAWNGRVDSNHRYTTSAALQQAMIAQGYVAEGYGPSAMPVAMCSPTTAAGAVPQCTLSASNPSPEVGTSISLSASCSGSPTQYTWSGCASSTATCMAQAGVSGIVTYAVTASNASGAGPTATVQVGWHDALPPLPPPACTLAVTTEGTPPVVGSTAVLNATCSNLPAGYAWSGCSSGTNTCFATEATPGTHGYAVAANNASGTGTPASVAVDWALAAPTPPDFCGSFPTYLYSIVPWANTTLYSVVFPAPGFAWNGAWVTRVSVPAGATATRNGSVTVVEYAGGPTGRQVTISRYACDFRPADPTGIAGPLYSASGMGINARVALGSAGSGTVALQPGETYYVNVRNAWPDGTISCPEATGSCGALVGITIPR